MNQRCFTINYNNGSYSPDKTWNEFKHKIHCQMLKGMASYQMQKEI